MDNLKEKSPKIDILNRDDFINRTVQLVESVGSHKGNITFAINGQWGCGKTFVLERIENKLSETKKFLVIHYNCWQYDYYDEPLVAIVSALQKHVDEAAFIKKREKAALKEIALKVGLNLVSQFGKRLIHIDPVELADTAKAALKKQEEIYSYDQYYDFNQALEDIKNELAKLSKDHTLVFAVDELDRCLPEYAIKVLERLHHITEGLSNIVTIIAVDKEKLEHTISSIFGEKSQKEYLKKFIRFELPLGNGNTNTDKFLEKFSDFRSRFDESLYPDLQKQSEFIKELFQGIDARSQEQIIEKATLFNDICFGDNKQDYTVMYMELFLATFYYYYQEKELISNNKIIDDKTCLFKYKNIPESFGKEGSGFYVGEKSKINGYNKGEAFVIESNDVFMIVIFYWYDLFVEKQRSMEEVYFPILDDDNACEYLSKNLQAFQKNIHVLTSIE